MKNNTAFIIGNASSRKKFDLNKLKGKGVIFGCNYLYQDFIPDVMVAFHSEPSETMNKLIPNVTRICKVDSAFGLIKGEYELEGVPELEPYPGIIKSWKLNNSGQCAIKIASKQTDINRIILIGFDFFKIIEEGKINGVYSDVITNRNSNNWINFFQELKQDIEIILVTKDLDEFYKHIPNITIINYDKLDLLLN